MRQMKSIRYGRVGVLGAALACAALTAACDVTNPGPIQDAFLGDKNAQVGLINGAERSIATAYTGNVLDMSLMAREVFPGGQTGAWGTNVANHAGHIMPEDDGGGFDNYQTARFIGETAIQRFTEAGASDENMYLAHLWTAFSYRILGEWWCDAVLADQDPTVTTPPEYVEGSTAGYFNRAVDNFTKAMSFATTQEEKEVALGGRASAELWLGDYAAALSDASQVSTDTKFQIEQDDAETALYNYMAEGNSGVFRSYTIRFTWFETYYDQTGDPRVPSHVDPDWDLAVGSLSGYGRVPYLPQTKFTHRTDGVNLVSGWEMKLVQAEAILQGAGSGDWHDALALINQVHTRNISDKTGDPLPALTASSKDETWTLLKRERRIELWLEGRSAADERRWKALGTPGTLDIPDWENPSNPGYTPLFVDYPRGRGPQGQAGPLCYDIPASERDRNPNVPPAVTGS